VRLGELAERERHDEKPDRDVHPEDPLPRDALDDRAADDGAERDREAADTTTPGAEREAASLGRHAGGEDRERERRDDRAADSLDRACGNERLDRRRERRSSRGNCGVLSRDLHGGRRSRPSTR